jgi:hypothetical protein
MVSKRKQRKDWLKEITDPHFLIVAVSGLILIFSGLYLFFNGTVPGLIFGLVLWSYGLICLGFSVGFNFGKYGRD